MSDSVGPHRWQPTRLPGILQARTLKWVAISFSNAWKWKVKVKLLSRVRLFAIPWTAAHQAPPSMEFSRQEYWSGRHCLLRKDLFGTSICIWTSRWFNSFSPPQCFPFGWYYLHPPEVRESTNEQCFFRQQAFLISPTLEASSPSSSCTELDGEGVADLLPGGDGELWGMLPPPTLSPSWALSCDWLMVVSWPCGIIPGCCLRSAGWALGLMAAIWGWEL